MLWLDGQPLCLLWDEVIFDVPGRFPVFNKISFKDTIKIFKKNPFRFKILISLYDNYWLNSKRLECGRGGSLVIPLMYPGEWFRYASSSHSMVTQPRNASEDIKNNAWVTVNNDFLVTSEVICQWFSRVTKSRVKIIGKSPHEWLKNCYSR